MSCRVDWNHISQDLDSHGNAIIENLISSKDCDAIVNLYSEYGIFHSRAVKNTSYGYNFGNKGVSRPDDLTAMAFDAHTTKLFVVKAPAVSNSNNTVDVFEGSGGPLATMGKRLIGRGISKDVQSSC
jgi:hypothetical protein